ncbi:MAG: ABC transporter substrate-binding protein [Pseudomonadota bacterium]
MIRLSLFFGLMLGWLGACTAPDEPVRSLGERPMRIVSLDYCADQFVLKFADRDHILAVSPDARKDFSFMRGAADGVESVRPLAEDVLILQPDLVVRAYGGGPKAAHFFERAGIPVLDVGWSPDIAAVRANTLRLAAALGHPERGIAVIDEMDRRLAEIAPSDERHSALYTTPGGVTAGPGGMVGEMLEAAGLVNFETRDGWHQLPLERLTRERPDVFVFADFDGGVGPWSAARHPVLRQRMDSADALEIEGAWTSCGGWFIIEAIEALAAESAP